MSIIQPLINPPSPQVKTCNCVCGACWRTADYSVTKHITDFTFATVPTTGAVTTTVLRGGYPAGTQSWYTPAITFTPPQTGGCPQ